jgi:hypothetical protein
MPDELHVERIIGRKVCDAAGAAIGRIGELIVENVDGEYVVTEVHVGAAALLERVGAFVTQLPYFALIRIPRWEYRLTWDQFDWTDPSRPRLRVRKAELDRVRKERAH